jgi:hypothetical protein
MRCHLGFWWSEKQVDKTSFRVFWNDQLGDKSCNNRDICKVRKTRHHISCLVIKGMRFLKILLGHNILYSHLIKFHYFADTVVQRLKEGVGGMKEGPKGGHTLGTSWVQQISPKQKGSEEVTSIVVPSWYWLRKWQVTNGSLHNLGFLYLWVVA